MTNTEPDYPDKGCKYWYGFCVMCPFPECLQKVTRKRRQVLINNYCIKILDEKKCAIDVICIGMKITRWQIYRALNKREE